MALFRRRRFIAEDDRLILQFDAELTVLRFVVEQLLVGIALSGPAPKDFVGTLFEAISTRLDEMETRHEEPYQQRRKPLLRVELERLLGNVTQAIAPKRENEPG
jgi:hypothetical protein